MVGSKSSKESGTIAPASFRALFLACQTEQGVQASGFQVVGDSGVRVSIAKYLRVDVPDLVFENQGVRVP